jgi:hypothetical protein
MKRFLPFSLLMIAVVVLAACGASPIGMGGGERSSAEPYFEYAPEMPAAPAMPADMDMEFAEQGKTAGGGGVNAASVERMIIENAEIAVVVSDVETRMAELQEMARGMGGHVVSSNLYKTYRNNIEAPEGTLVIRVPSGNLNDALANIKAGAVEVQNETRSGQDVTSQYVDLKSRLKNLEAAEAQLTEIMKNATETEDVVNIFNQLVYYREQIELVKGQMKYLEESAALSAITIRLIAEDTIRPLEIGGWKPQGIARDAIQDLINFWQNFVNFLIRFVIYTLPVWITVGVPLYLVFIGVRALFRRLRGNKAKVDEQVVEKKAEKK